MNMQDLVDTKMVQIRPHDRLPLNLYRYHKKVFWKGLFEEDPRLRFARGLGLHDDGRIIVRPFYKVYNLNENDAGHNWSEDAPVLIERKVNGFMACVTRYEDELVYSTTGTFDSDYAELAKRYIEKQVVLNKLHHGFTYIFEICAEEDPHIIEEKPGAYLLAMMPNDLYPKYMENSYIEYDLFGAADYYHPWNMVKGIRDTMNACIAYHEHLSMVAQSMNAHGIEKEVVPFKEAKKKARECDHEGYMMTNLSDEVERYDSVIKVKSPLYLSTKFFARYKLKGNEDVEEMKKRVDEEYYPFLEHVFNDDTPFFELEEQDRIHYIRSWFTQNTT